MVKCDVDYGLNVAKPFLKYIGIVPPENENTIKLNRQIKV